MAEKLAKKWLKKWPKNGQKMVEDGKNHNMSTFDPELHRSKSLNF